MITQVQPSVPSSLVYRTPAPQFDDAYILESLRQAESMIRHIASTYHMEYDDLYQEAYLIARKRASVLPEKTDPRAYLRRAIQGHLLDLARGERWHSCECGCEMDRDHNAARNILTLGLQQLSGGTRPTSATA